MLCLWCSKYLGKDPDTTNPADFDAVVEAFKPIRKYIKAFDASNYLNALPNKETRAGRHLLGTEVDDSGIQWALLARE